MSKLHFIKAPCHQSTREAGYELAPDEIKERYDYEFKKEDFISDNGHCIGYQKLYDYIREYTKNKPNDKIITIGGDHSISASTISAMNEKYIKLIDNKQNSNLKILWIDQFPDICESKDLNDIPVASLVGAIPSLVTQKILINPDQIIFLGLEDVEDIHTLNQYGFQYYTQKKIKSIGLDKILHIIKNYIKDSPLHISYDVSSKFNQSDLENIFSYFKQQVVSMDIVEFNPLIGTKKDVKLTKNLIRNCLIKLFDIKEKSINIFTEDSEFLIFRPLEQENIETDYGWFILRGLSVTDRENIIKLIEKDSIITVNIEDEDYLITKTTMNEQINKSYYTSLKIEDITLFPEEKKLMCFELINSTIN